MTCSDVSLKGDIVAAGFSNSIVKIWLYKWEVVREVKESDDEDEEKEEEKKDEEPLTEADKQEKLRQEVLK